jgi:flagellar biosynthesis/type III secretory pathway chaperone
MTDEVSTVAAIVAGQIDCAEAMLEALTAEERALVGGTPEELRAASAAKGTLVETLEALETERRRLGSSADLPAEHRARLHELIAECKRQNQRNGVLLKARADNVSVALRALRGGEPELYGASGRTPARTDTRPLGTA